MNQEQATLHVVKEGDRFLNTNDLRFPIKVESIVERPGFKDGVVFSFGEELAVMPMDDFLLQINKGTFAPIPLPKFKVGDRVFDPSRNIVITIQWVPEGPAQDSIFGDSYLYGVQQYDPSSTRVTYTACYEDYLKICQASFNKEEVWPEPILRQSINLYEVPHIHSITIGNLSDLKTNL